MKEYESPKAFKLDDTESAHGECTPGSTPGDSCGPGNFATGCGNPGNSAERACGGPGNDAWTSCNDGAGVHNA